MSEAIDPNGTHVETSRPRLGELLVERGLLTPERLEEALEKQRATNLPLGTILVQDGLVPTHAIAMALADQVGAPLKTEHGYATGHGPRGTPPPAPGGVRPLRPPPTTDSLDPPAILPGLRLPDPPAPTEPVSGLRLPDPPAPTEPVSGLRLPDPPLPEPVPAPVPEPVSAPPPAPTPEPQVDLPSLPEPEARELPPAEHDVETSLIETRFAALEARAAELEASLAAAAGDRDAEPAFAEELRARISELEELVALYRAEATTPPPAGRVYSSERHVLMAVNGERYELFERKGPAPEVGEVVRMSGDRSYRVLRVGPAPYPGAYEACAFLDEIRPRGEEGPGGFEPPTQGL